MAAVYSVFVAALAILSFGINPASAIAHLNYKLVEGTGAEFSVGNIQTQITGTEYKFANNSDSSSTCLKYFNLLSSGEIQTKINIDREALAQDSITCVVTYTTQQGPKSSLLVTVDVQDVNDVVPRFSGLQRPIHNITIYEDLDEGQVVLYLMPFDPDSGLNGTVNYTITNGNEAGYFDLRLPMNVEKNFPDRVLYLVKELDFEQTPLFNLTVRITDKGPQPLVSFQYILINIADVNDRDPTFPISNFYFDLPETHPIGKEHPFGKINATDEDSAIHAQIFYQLSQSSLSEYGELFAVNTTTGELYILQAFDYDDSDEPKVYTFLVDARNPESATGTNAEITVTVIDENDEKPLLIKFADYEISENVIPDNFIAIFKDKDSSFINNEIVTASISFNPAVNHTQPNVQENTVLSSTIYFVNFKITQTLDRETTPFIYLTMHVTDNGTPPQTSENIITITVTDENDNAPQFLQEKFTGKIAEVSKPTRLVSTILASDPDLGSNAEFSYAIDNTIPEIAGEWFSINSTTGEIYLVADPSYSATIDGRVDITVIANDTGGNSNSTLVEISVLPSVTFQPNSFMEYSNIDLIASSVVYLEFRTDRNSSNLLLLYQHSAASSLTVSLEIINSKIVYSTNGVSQIEKTVHLLQNKWYSVLLNKNDLTDNIEVWEKDKVMNNTAIELLRTSNFNRCSDQRAESTTSLYVGGVKNIFSLPENIVSSYDFNGEISVVIIDNNQLDTSCPYDQGRVLNGSHLTTLCTPFSNPCNKEYSSCVSYTADNEVCQCSTGFPADSCNEETDFGPISVTGGSHIEFDLGYDYFFHTAPSIEANSQTVTMTIVSATTDPSGVLFYFKTGTSVHLLEIDQTIRYTVRSAVDYTYLLSSISEKVTVLQGTRYNITLQISNDALKMYFGETGRDLRLLDSERNIYNSNSVPNTFTKQPYTRVSIGGSSDGKFDITVEGNFSGCVTGFSIDGAPIPLNNFIETGHQNLQVFGSRDNVTRSCHGCYTPGSCPDNSLCVITGHFSSNTHECRCLNGYQSRNNTCVNPTLATNAVTPTVSPIPTGRGQITDGIENPTTTTRLSLHAIMGIAGGCLFVFIVLFAALLLVIRCAYTRGKQKQTVQFAMRVSYPANNEEEIDSKQDSIIPGVTRVTRPRPNNYVQTAIKHTRDPSSEIDTDSTIDGPAHSFCSYRKSTSQETGFHTASEFDTPSRQSSPRRAYDSGKSSSEQYDSDIETDSESLNTSGIEECLSPRDMRLLNSNGNIPMGVPPHYRKKHLSSKERIALTPLHPNASYLLTEDETSSEVSTTTNTTNQRMCNDNDSIMSDPDGPKWYKQSSPSTIVSSDNTPSHYNSHTLDSYKRSKRRMPPGTFRPHKSNSPPHFYVSHNGHPQLSSSPLVQKAHRFDYPAPYSPASSSSRGFHYDAAVDMGGARLPSIEESAQFLHHQPPYHMRQHSDHVYRDNRHIPHPHPHQIHPELDPIPYYPGYQGTNLTPGGGVAGLTPGSGISSINYRDLNSFAQVNPITYWEQQQRLRPTVDDGLSFLAEPYTKFEDVSTTPSVVESTIIDDESSVITSSEFGGIRRPMTSRGLHGEVPPVMLSKLPRSRRNSERDSSELISRDMNGSNTTLEDDAVPNQYPITHFPSADCNTPTFISSRERNGMLNSASTLAAED